MIHVCYCLHDKNGRYSKFTGTSIVSMFENTKAKIIVNILHDNTLTQDNRKKFIQIAKTYKQTVKFYNVEENYADKVAEFKEMLPTLNTLGTRTVGNLFRFFIPKILNKDVSKIIYFDSDIIINSDVNELWQFNLNSAPLAAVPEVESYVDTNMHVLV